MFKKINALSVILTLLVFSGSVLAATFDLSTGVNVGAPGNPLFAAGARPAFSKTEPTHRILN